MSDVPAPRVERQAPEAMPRDIHNAYIFEVFNTASWSVVLGSPMLLFFQHLGATATLLAIAACLSPTLNILQLPAAQYVERVGYRRFVLRGWTSRSVVVVMMTVVAFLAVHLDAGLCMWLMLGLSLIYNTMRGISVCGMLPWFTAIVPESRRGEFLAKDQICGALAGIACLFLSGTLLQLRIAGFAYGIVFAVSAGCAFASLTFLRRIPDVPVEKIVKNPAPLPWKEMFFYPPFFRYVRYNVVMNMALGASGVFWVRFFRAELHARESGILYVACASWSILAACLFLVGPLLDRTGNKPALTAAGLMFILHFSGWSLVAAHILPFNLIVLSIQCMTSGLGGALWNLSNVRTVMGIVPQMGRPHFLALYSVASNLTVGLVPLVWGQVIDRLESSGWRAHWDAWDWNPYSLFYVTLALTVGAGLVFLRQVTEPETMTWDEFMAELLVKTPSRAISRLIVRLRGPTVG